MDIKDKLYPDAIKDQSRDAIGKLSTDIEALDLADKAIADFMADKQIKSKAFDALKKSCKQYRTVIGKLKKANETDIKDFNVLISSVGSEVLLGKEIIPNKNKAWEDKGKHEKKAHDYREAAHNTTDIFQKAEYYAKAEHNEMLAELDYITFLYWKGKEDKFDSIQAATCNLFNASLVYKTDCVADPNDPNSVGLSGEVENSLCTVVFKKKFSGRLKDIDDAEELLKKVKNEEINVENLTENQKEMIAVYYEENHPEDAKKLNKATKNLSEAEALDVKVRVYTAPRIYKENFIKNVKDVADAKKNFKDFQDGKIKLEKLNDKDTAEAVAWYDIYHLDEAQSMTKNLTPLINEGYEGHVNNIKLLSYTAAEPYKSVFLENVGNVIVADIHYSDRTSYECQGEIFIDVDDMGNASKAGADKYRTYFHEVSHGIDYRFKYLSCDYTNSTGVSLDDSLQSEIREKIRKHTLDVIKNDGYSAAEQQQIVDMMTKVIMNTYTKDPDAVPTFGANGTMQAYYVKIREGVKDEVFGEMSDIYGGYSSNRLVNSCYHDAFSEELNDDGTTSYRTYWIASDISDDGFVTPHYDSNSNIVYSGMQQMEFFAENMSAQMTRDEEQMEGYNGYSEQTKDIFNGIIDEMDSAN